MLLQYTQRKKNMNKIYLAPSCQTWNEGKYALFNTNEAKQANLITGYIVKELAKYRCEVHRGVITTGLGGNEKRANDLHCASYYAIHTNAGPASAHGVTALYQSWKGFSLSRRLKSHKMASELCKGIASMGRTNRGPVVGKKQSDGKEYFGDLRVPNMPSAILEIEFHTNLDSTKWIMGNPAEIGKKIAKVIVSVEKLKLEPQAYPGAFPVFPVGVGFGSEADVLRWQKFLCWAGYKTALDGEFGPDCKRQTIAFQKAHGLEKDGMAGIKTVGIAKDVTR